MKEIIGKLKLEIDKRNKKIKETRTEIKKLESAILELERKFKKGMKTEKRKYRKRKFKSVGLTKKRSFVKWSNWEKKVMTGMLDSGKSVTDVSKKLGRSYSSVMNQKVWLEKKRREKELEQRGIPKQVQFVFDGDKADFGKSNKVSKQDEPKQKKRGRPKGSKNKNRKRKYRYFTMAEDRMIVGMRNNGYSNYQIAKRLRRAKQSVKQRAERLGA